MIAVVDYGAGNLRSVRNALELLGEDYRIVQRSVEIANAARILLPGVGHFGSMMKELGEMASGLVEAANGGVPLMGICLGMQALFEASEEADGVPGLGLIPGIVRRFVDVPKVPHMGWNDVTFLNGTCETFYFANSFYAPVGEWTEGLTDYGSTRFTASVRRAEVSGVQFHPEKSGPAGIALLGAWCSSC